MYLEDLSKEDVISLGYKYLNGDEENGIFIDYDKAKFCFDFVNWNEDTTEKINPDCDLLIADYYLNGNSITINCIKDMIVDLTFRFGTPDNDDGLFVPIEVLMQIFVDNGGLLLHVEAETIKPLLYAMRLVFTDMQIEMKQIV